MEARHSEEGHRDADLQVGAEVGLHVFAAELGQAVVQRLIKQLFIEGGDLKLLGFNFLKVGQFLHLLLFKALFLGCRVGLELLSLSFELVNLLLNVKHQLT